MSRFARLCAFLFVLFFSGNLMAGYPACSTTREYTSCNPGFYMSGCDDSPSSWNGGRTTSSEGNSCKSCPDGYTCAGGNVCPVRNGINCAAGTYIKANTTTCTSCPAGKYCPGITTDSVTSSTSDRGITQCPAGSFCPAGSGSATTCPTNYVNSTAGSDAASDCYTRCAVGTAVTVPKTACGTPAGAWYSVAHAVYYGEISPIWYCPYGSDSRNGVTSLHDQAADCLVTVPAGYSSTVEDVNALYIRISSETGAFPLAEIRVISGGVPLGMTAFSSMVNSAAATDGDLSTQAIVTTTSANGYTGVFKINSILTFSTIQFALGNMTEARDIVIAISTDNATWRPVFSGTVFGVSALPGVMQTVQINRRTNTKCDAGTYSGVTSVIATDSVTCTACPTAADHKMTSYSNLTDAAYVYSSENLVFESIELLGWDSLKGGTSIESCAVGYKYNNSRGHFTIEAVRYNSSTGKYDKGGDLYYKQPNAGYYLTTKYSDAYCNVSSRSMLYLDAQPCPAGSYCGGRTGLTACSSGTYDDTLGIDGLVSVGYYSTGGAKVATPTSSSDCVAGGQCGPLAAGYYSVVAGMKESTPSYMADDCGVATIDGVANSQACGPVNAGYYSSGGGTHPRPTGSGDGCISSKQCGKIAAGYWGRDGATQSGGNGQIAAGYFSTGGAVTSTPSGSTSCAAGESCGKIAAGYWSASGAKTATPATTSDCVGGNCGLIHFGFYSTGGGKNPRPYPSSGQGEACLDGFECGYVAGGYYSNGGGTSATPTAFGNGCVGQWNNNGTMTNHICGKVDAGYFSTGGAVSPTPTASDCHGYNETDETAVDANRCGMIAAGYWGEKGATSATGKNMVNAGYYSTGGGTSATPTAAGNGCLSGQECGKVAAGYYSTGGGTLEKPTAAGNGCLSGQSCGKTSSGCYGSAGATTACPNMCSYLTDSGIYNQSKAGSTSANDCYINGSAMGGYFILVEGGDRVACPQGSYSSANSVYYGETSTCTPCPGGTTTAGTGSHEGQCTVSCPNSANVYGWVTPEFKASSTSYVKNLCVVASCSAGAAMGQDGACSKCPAGHFQDVNGYTGGTCSQAAPGYYVGTTGASKQTPCPAGKYASTTGSTSCTPVDAGYWNNGCGINSNGDVCSTSYSGGEIKDACYGAAGATAECPNECSKLVAPSLVGGTHSSVTPRSASTSCRYKLPNKTHEQCSSITANAVAYNGSGWGTNYYTVSAKPGAIVTASGNTATPSCSLCGAGKYSAGGSATSCGTCPAAETGWTMSSATGLTAFTECTETTTPSVTSSPIASICTAGTLTKKATSATAWGTATASGLSAAAGYHVNGTTCSACGGSNYYCPGGTATKKTVDSGYYSTGGTSTTRTSQSICEKGNKCVSGVKTACSGTNEWQDLTGQTSCKTVTDGMYKKDNTELQNCGTGYYCMSGARNQCPNSGTTADAVRSKIGECYKSGLSLTVSNGSGTQRCFYTSGTGTSAIYSSSCDTKTVTACNGGYYRAAASDLSCTKVGIGYYSGASSLTRAACADWRANTSTTGETSSSTDSCVCVAGRYLDGSNVCTVCAKGSYKSGKGNAACTEAISGQYVDTTGATTYKSCSALNAFYTKSDSGFDSNADCFGNTTATNYVAEAGKGQVSCTGGYCEGGTKVYYATGTGATTGGRKTLSNWTCPGGADAASDCYRGITLKKNGMSGTLALPSSSGCKSVGGATGTSDDTVQVYYGVACKLPTTALSGSATGTTYNSTGSWATSANAASGFVTSITLTDTSATTPVRYAGKKYTCAAGYYLTANTNGACSECTSGNWCEGISGKYYSTSAQGLSACSGLGTGYTSDGTKAATTNTKCYLPVADGKIRTGTSGTTLQSCAAGTFKAAHNEYYGTSYSCSDCTGRTKYSAAGAKACSSVSSGYYTEGCDASGNKCTKQTQCDGSVYCTDGVKKDCPAAESSSWTLGTGKGWTAFTSCFETRAATNVSQYCSAGQLKKNATSATAWGTATISDALQAKPGAIVEGQTCKQCTGATYSAGGSATSCSACDTNYQANTSAGKSDASQCQISCAAGTAVVEKNKACAVLSGGKYKTGTALVNYGSLSPTATDITSGWAVGTVYSCPSSYGISGTTAANHDARTDCTISCPAGTQVASANATCTTPSGTTWYTSGHSVAAGSTSGSNVKSCNSGYTTPNTTTQSDHDAAADCKISCGAGYYVPSAGQGCKVCTAGKYCSAVNGIAQTATTAVTGDVSAGYWNNGCGTNATGGVCSSSYAGGEITAGYYGVAGATTATGSGMVNKGYWNDGCGINATGGVCNTNHNGGQVNAGYYNLGGGTSATPEVRGKGCVNVSTTQCGTVAPGYWGAAGATQYGGSGAVAPGYYSTGGATSRTPSASDCAGKVAIIENGKLMGASDVNNTCGQVQAGYWNNACGINATGGVCSTSYQGGIIAAGYWGTAGATDSVGSGRVAPGYYSTGGATIEYPDPNQCVGNNTCGAIDAGYWNNGGGTLAAPTAPGTGCHSDKSCGTVNGGYYSTGGGTSATPTAAGNGCLANKSCGKLSAIYYSNGGSTSDGATCVSGKTCGTCDANYRANTETGKTSASQCQISCAAGTAVVEKNKACASIKNATYKGKWIGNHSVNYGSTSTIQSCPTYYQDGNGTTAQNQCQISCAAGTRVAARNAACTSPAGGWFSAATLTSYGNISPVSYCMDGYISTSTSASGHDAATDCVQTIAGGKYVPSSKINARYVKLTGNLENSANNYGVHVVEMQAFASNDGTGTNLMAGSTSDKTTDEDWTTSSYESIYTAKTWDLGSVQSLGSLKFALYPGRTYYDVAIYVSEDNTNWTTVFGPQDVLTQSISPLVGEVVVLSAVPKSCAAGTYKVSGSLALTNTSSCNAAQAGYFVGTTGATTQTKCVMGSYTDTTGQSACKACAGGKTNSADGATSCTATCSNATGVASTGWETPVWGTDNKMTNLCTIKATAGCSAKYYKNSNACLMCPDGYQDGGAGYTQISQCTMNVEGGKYVKVANESSASGTCGLGTYKPAHTVTYGKTSSCSACTGATYADQEGMSACTACPIATKYADKVVAYDNYGKKERRYCYAKFEADIAHGDTTYFYCYLNGDTDYGIRTTGGSCWTHGARTKCDAGYYSPVVPSAQHDEMWYMNYSTVVNNLCMPVESGYWSGADSLTRTACETGLVTCGAGLCANEAGDCGRKLHAGDNVIYLRSQKRTGVSPLLHLKVGDKMFYGNMSTSLSSPLKVKYNNTKYSVVNDNQ